MKYYLAISSANYKGYPVNCNCKENISVLDTG